MYTHAGGTPRQNLIPDRKWVHMPDEPYAFGPEHAEELRVVGLDARFVHADGKHLSWYGPRIPEALAGLWALVAEP